LDVVEVDLAPAPVDWMPLAGEAHAPTEVDQSAPMVAQRELPAGAELTEPEPAAVPAEPTAVPAEPEPVPDEPAAASDEPAPVPAEPEPVPAADETGAAEAEPQPTPVPDDLATAGAEGPAQPGEPAPAGAGSPPAPAPTAEAEPRPATSAQQARRDIHRGLAALSAVPPMDNELAGGALPTFLDLNQSMPGAPLVSAVIRLDRLRDTIWAEHSEAILAPLPDYRTLVPAGSKSFFDHFDAMVISSPRPYDVTATMVATRVHGAPREVLSRIAHAEEIRWSTQAPGQVGIRPDAALIHPSDRRVIVQPDERWLALTPPSYLTEPAWLHTLDALERAATRDETTVAAITIELAGLRPRRGVRLPIATPQRLVVTLHQAKRGFYVRGQAVFASSDEAAAAAGVARAGVVGAAVHLGYRPQLEQIGLLNAARGLRLLTRGETVHFATSLSILDARALMTSAAQLTGALYETGRFGAPLPLTPPLGPR
jgi:hypothetical protein